jgi:hypothetical protein
LVLGQISVQLSHRGGVTVGAVVGDAVGDGVGHHGAHPYEVSSALPVQSHGVVPQLRGLGLVQVRERVCLPLHMFPLHVDSVHDLSQALHEPQSDHPPMRRGFSTQVS